MKKIVNIAVLIQCEGCTGSGQMRFGKIEFDCIRCNSHGCKIEIVTKGEMREYLETDDVRGGGNLTIQLEKARI